MYRYTQCVGAFLLKLEFYMHFKAYKIAIKSARILCISNAEREKTKRVASYSNRSLLTHIFYLWMSKLFILYLNCTCGTFSKWWTFFFELSLFGFNYVYNINTIYIQSVTELGFFQIHANKGKYVLFQLKIFRGTYRSIYAILSVIKGSLFLSIFVLK